jgi:hypothetical protein
MVRDVAYSTDIALKCLSPKLSSTCNSLTGSVKSVSASTLPWRLAESVAEGGTGTGPFDKLLSSSANAPAVLRQPNRPACRHEFCLRVPTARPMQLPATRSRRSGLAVYPSDSGQDRSFLGNVQRIGGPILRPARTLFGYPH